METGHALPRLASMLGIAGGILSLVVGGMVTVSVIGRALFDQGVPGDFELVQMLTAVSVFFFLPACQARRGNIVVDTFTGFLNEKARNALDAFWDVVYGLVMAVIGIAMVQGTYEAWKSNTTTMVSQFQTWPALFISTALLFVLAVTCLWTARMLVKGR